MHVRRQQGYFGRVQNVLAFAIHLSKPAEVAGLGTLEVDTSYGSMMFAHENARALGFEITPNEAHKMCLVGQKIKFAVNEQLGVVHPENPKICVVSNIIFEGDIKREGHRLEAHNGVVALHGRLDRSPCGTVTSGRLAAMSAKGLIAPGESFRNISNTGTHFDCRIIETTKVADYDAVIVTIAGQAWITSVGQYGVDPTDPFPLGHTVSDVWF